MRVATGRAVLINLSLIPNPDGVLQVVAHLEFRVAHPLRLTHCNPTSQRIEQPAGCIRKEKKCLPSAETWIEIAFNPCLYYWSSVVKVQVLHYKCNLTIPVCQGDASHLVFRTMIASGNSVSIMRNTSFQSPPANPELMPKGRYTGFLPA